MLSPKIVKIVIKTALGFGVSALIGYTIKMEKLVEEHIDGHFETKDNKDN